MNSPTTSVFSMASTASTRRPKPAADFSASFASFGENELVFPPQFVDLKKEIWTDGLVESWREVLGELEVVTAQMAEQKQKMIPQVTFESIQNGLSAEDIERIRTAGCVVVKGAIPKEEVLGWKEDVKKYAAANPGKVRGFPADNIQVYELYNTVSQTRARTHPNALATQKFLLSLWHDASGNVALDTPIVYFDRLRMRQPGDAKFALGPHVDGGSVERWEDPQYRSCFAKILEGKWREYDPYDAAPRVGANQDLHESASQCSIFRPWQGWTAMSTTGPGEGTLCVFPHLRLATAYWMLRPFFQPRDLKSPSLKFEDWNVLNLDTPVFPGSTVGAGQEMTEQTHPHLRLDKAMISMPLVEPGDQVFWHTDCIHAVESYHGGQNDSSVFYIPAVPLTATNAEYLRDQRDNFIAGFPAPDFPGGVGESEFVGRATADDILPGGRAAMGFDKFEGERPLFEEANSILAVY